MLIFDFNRDIKLALTATIFDEKIFADMMTMVKISDYFHYIITLLCYVMKLAGMICKLDRFLEICRLCSAFCKLAGKSTQSTNWQIGLQIGQIGRLDGTQYTCTCSTGRSVNMFYGLYTPSFGIDSSSIRYQQPCLA